MPSRSHEPARTQCAQGGYPQPDKVTALAIKEKLIEVVSLLHRGAVSEAQLRELAAGIDAQARNAETLHKFTLTNADEPAFVFRIL
jgi:hypothetical protein